MRCAIYLRVSTDRQARGVTGRYADDTDNAKFSLPSQRQACIEYAIKRDWTVEENHIFVEANTAFELWERPKLTEVRKLMASKEIDVLLVYALDRLSRDQNHQGLLFSEGVRFGVKIDSVTEDIDDTPIGKFIRSSYGMIAEMEAQKLAERSIRGRRARALKGGEMPVIGVRPFGYNFDGNRKQHLVINEDEAYWLRAIFERIAAGHSLYSVKKFLEENKVPTATGKSNWRSPTIAQIVRNELYKGVVYAMKYGNYSEEREHLSKRQNQDALKDRDQWIRVDYSPPLIISPDLWEQAQVALSERGKRKAPGNDKSRRKDVMLNGTRQIVCAECGVQMSIQTARRTLSTGETAEYIYYRHPGESPTCSSFTLRTDEIDAFVWELVLNYILDPQKFHEQRRLREESDPTKQDREMVEYRIEELRKEHATQTKSFALVAADLDELTRGVILQEIRDKSEQIKSLEAELERLKLRHQAWAVRQQHVEVMEEAVQSLRPLVEEHADLEMRQTFMLALGVRVEVFPKKKGERPRVYVNPSIDGVHQIQLSGDIADAVCGSSLVSSNERQFTNYDAPLRLDDLWDLIQSTLQKAA